MRFFNRSIFLHNAYQLIGLYETLDILVAMTLGGHKILSESSESVIVHRT